MKESRTARSGALSTLREERIERRRARAAALHDVFAPARD